MKPKVQWYVHKMTPLGLLLVVFIQFTYSQPVS